MAIIKIKRVYEPAEESDGFRILVDRLWPRGIKKEEARLDAWLKEIAPSNELRKWFHHKTITLVYSAKDEQHNQAVVLKQFLEQEIRT
jgi:uncharacterized protein YeaO (DUF488 family)